jgi:hypothetical protein
MMANLAKASSHALILTGVKINYQSLANGLLPKACEWSFSLEFSLAENHCTLLYWG